MNLSQRSLPAVLVLSLAVAGTDAMAQSIASRVADSQATAVWKPRSEKPAPPG